MWAIIGGSGFEKFEGFKELEPIDRETPFGLASSGIKKVQVGDHTCLFLSRHGAHHEKLPSEVNYRANIYALKKHGAKGILAFSAVGSLREGLAPGDLVIPTQYIDRTKGVRAHSFCGEGVVGHVSLAHPVSPKVAQKTLSLASPTDWKVHALKTYVCIEGPYFSTVAESHSYRQMGADIIGMTNFPEFALAREAGLNYLPCCFVTDYDCWNEERPHVTLDEVIQVMRQNNSKAFALAQSILDKCSDGYSYWEGETSEADGLKSGLMTPMEAIPDDKKAWLEVLMS